MFKTNVSGHNKILGGAKNTSVYDLNVFEMTEKH